MTKAEMLAYWMKSASEDVLTAQSLFTTKRYVSCLFYCHLFIEKILKAFIVNHTGEPAPFGHKLVKLAEFTPIAFSEEQLKLLDDLTGFNIRARYEDYKFSLYKRATAPYTKSYLDASIKLYIWLKHPLS